MTKGEIINAIYKANLTKRATLVVFYLINRANREMTCFPGVKTIARECNISARTVQRALNDLIEVGFLKRESRFHKQGGQRSNLYTLMIAEKKAEEYLDSTVTFDSYANEIDKVERKVSNKDETLKIEQDFCKKDDSIYCNRNSKIKKQIKNVGNKYKMYMYRLLAWGVRQLDTPLII